MAPKEKQKIEIEKSHRDPLLSFNQAVTVDCSDFLGTALKITPVNMRLFSLFPFSRNISKRAICQLFASFRFGRMALHSGALRPVG